MNAKTLLTFALLSLFTLAQGQKTINTTLYFESNSSVLNDESQADLNSWIEKLGPNNIQSMTIAGHTDADGSNKFNRELSERRAETVKTFLNNRSIQSKVLNVNSLGETLPIALNENEEDKWQNRRVEIVATLEKPTYAEISDKLGPAKQSFQFPSNEPISIKGTGGTEIMIAANTLVDGSGKVVTGPVTIELTEYLVKSDFLFGGLHTQSGDRLLETGGTVLVEAYSNGEKLQLAKGQKMDILFASREDGDGMEVFNGVVNESGEMDWGQSTGTSISFVAEELISGEFKTAYRRNGRLVKGVIIDGQFIEETVDSALVAEYEEQAEMTSLMMSSSKLGWINCDRFSPAEQNTELMVNVDTVYHPSVYLVFEDINSVMRGYYWDKEIKFQRIPSNKKVKVVALSYVNDQPYYAVEELTTQSVSEVELAMLPIGEDELKKALKRIN